MALRIQLSETKLAEFAARYQVAELAVFGSALRDDFSPTSDVDLLVTFLPGAEVSLFDLVDMGDELSRLLGRPVDLVPKSGIKPRIRGSVLESSRIIYAAA
jgi:predicted nucleotidyltransferase